MINKAGVLNLDRSLNAHRISPMGLFKSAPSKGLRGGRGRRVTAAQMFSITSGELCEVTFLLLARAARGSSQGEGALKHTVHCDLKIAPNYGPSCERFPPSCRLGKGGGAAFRGRSPGFRLRLCTVTSLMACWKATVSNSIVAFNPLRQWCQSRCNGRPCV